MANFLSKREQEQLDPAETATFRSPVPTQIISNGEFNPLPQTPEQKKVEARVKELTEQWAPKHGMSADRFLKSSAGMAAAFSAMNDVFGPVYAVQKDEGSAPGHAEERAKKLAGQFIVDVQTHFVRDDYNEEDMLDLARYTRKHWNPGLVGENDLSRYKFENYVKEVFIDSDTKIALLSGTPYDDPNWEFLTNDQIAAARRAINQVAGARRLLCHSVITPKREGWLDVVDHAIAELRPESWKCHTVGDPLTPSEVGSYWRLDDEKLMYPFYEKIIKAGITTICIHKGMLPADYQETWPEVWEYATVWDVGKAAKDWPQIRFVIYHSAVRPFLEPPEAALSEFEKTGRIKWATDLAEIPEKFGVSNVYGEIGAVFACCAVSSPRYAAAILGTLVKGLGADRVLWGTDSVWYGSPQWQIEAMRRLEIPEDLQKRHGFAPLGSADGATKTAIFSGNAVRLYNVDAHAALGSVCKDNIAAMKQEYVARGGLRSNARYGYVPKPGTAKKKSPLARYM